MTDSSVAGVPSVPRDIIIVVGRQFGSGGRSLGKMLAEHYGLSYYDKELISASAERLGLSRELFDHYDEKPPSPLRAFISNAFGGQDSAYRNPASSEGIYALQSKVIRELADRGGCVFVGRSADYILRDKPNLVSVFLHAPVEHRAQVILKRGETSNPEKGVELAQKFDRNRENYYNYFTGRHWGHSDNYHLTLDTSLLGLDGTFDVIRHYIEARFGDRK